MPHQFEATSTALQLQLASGAASAADHQLPSNSLSVEYIVRSSVWPKRPLSAWVHTLLSVVMKWERENEFKELLEKAVKKGSKAPITAAQNIAVGDMAQVCSLVLCCCFAACNSRQPEARSAVLQARMCTGGATDEEG